MKKQSIHLTAKQLQQSGKKSKKPLIQSVVPNLQGSITSTGQLLSSGEKGKVLKMFHTHQSTTESRS